ncbi:Ldh family oxidoreductase [Salinisphaera sp. SPP-AMP-43]|uniref:Ldh family oxidoreductase n=1 Tax=Salinisphaera sp. SPP-AMP-43 TaxID=3121288 RepID=UPI003C6DD40B
MSSNRTLTVAAAQALARDALSAAGAGDDQAERVAAALIAAELDGLPSHGLARVAAYAAQVAAGKVDGRAEPVVTRCAPSAVTVDAGYGFAYTAIDTGLAEAVPRAAETGCCALAIAHSHHAGVLGHHVERIAEQGQIGLAFANAPASIAAWGGRRPAYGTNPLAFAAPREQAAPLVVDLSVAVVARGHVMFAAQRGEAIPEGWALDADGQPTTDAQAALAGTMQPMGGAKGAALALVVEILAAALTGSSASAGASSLFDASGGPPDLGQSFILIDPERLGGRDFGPSLEALLAQITAEPGVRLPGARRQAQRRIKAEAGIVLGAELLAQLESLAAGAS